MDAGRQPVAIMPTFRWAKFLEGWRSRSRVWPGCQENRPGQKRTRVDKTRESSQEMKDPPGIAAGEAGSGARNTN